jgi:hypothetical protein
MRHEARLYNRLPLRNHNCESYIKIKTELHEGQSRIFNILMKIPYDINQICIKFRRKWGINMMFQEYDVTFVLTYFAQLFSF